MNVTGLVAAAFTHRDSRAGDPDLHTHVAVANKVQTLGGRWLSIDGRVLHAAKVAVSETYNTALEHHLTTVLGVRFAERPGGDRSKRPVREIVGVDPRLNRRWSARRQVIDVRKAELAAAFARDHGRPPGRVEMLQLAQQATLETRDRKHEPRTLAEQRTVWRTEAVETLGGGHEIEAMLRRTLNPPALRPVPTVTAAWRAETADRVIAALEEHRATWQYWHLWAETQRQLRGCGIDPADTADGATAVVEEAINRSIRLTPVDDPAGLPDHLRRTDGASVFTVAGSDQYTSTRILAAEQRLLAAAGRTDGRTLEPGRGRPRAGRGNSRRHDVWTPGRAQMVRTLATDRRRVQLVIAPAGAGKTTALRVLADTWTGRRRSHPRPRPLRRRRGPARRSHRHPRRHPAPAHLGHPASTSAPGLGRPDRPEDATADRRSRDGRHPHPRHRRHPRRRAGVAGCAWSATTSSSAPSAPAASWPTSTPRTGRSGSPSCTASPTPTKPPPPSRSATETPEAVDFYTDRDRIEIGDPAGLPDRILAAWRHDQDQGLDSLMLAPSRRQVADLNQRARAARLAGQAPTAQVELADGNQASTGDVIITRRNDRRLTAGTSGSGTATGGPSPMSPGTAPSASPTAAPRRR